jgi:hypothetical protein
VNLGLSYVTKKLLRFEKLFLSVEFAMCIKSEIESQLMLRRNLSTPSSGSKSKPSKKTAGRSRVRSAVFTAPRPNISCLGHHLTSNVEAIFFFAKH